MSEIKTKTDTLNKKSLGKFFTTNADYILQELSLPNCNKINIVEPFFGNGDLIKWLFKTSPKINEKNIECYDIDPKIKNFIIDKEDDKEKVELKILERDTLINPPKYENKWILTNPPYLARNQSINKIIYDKYNTNDLYKAFIYSLGKKCLGGIIIIPLGFFISPRPIDIKCRSFFLENYEVLRVNYFEENVFKDTSTTVISILFQQKIKDKLIQQNIKWKRYPFKDEKEFVLKKENNWIIGGEIYNLFNNYIKNNLKINNDTKLLINAIKKIKVKRLLISDIDKKTANLTLNALDSGKKDGRIKLEYRDKPYYGKESSRTYASIYLNNLEEINKIDKFKEWVFNKEFQIKLVYEFNKFLEEKRTETWSLFLPQFRESKEYARKRITFDLAYQIILYHLFLILQKE